MAHPDSTDRRVQVAGAIAITGLSACTLWRYVRDGKFPAPTYIANRRTWLESELRGWVEAEAAKPRRRQAGRLLHVSAP